MEGFKLNSITKIKDGKYLKNYELNYTNKIGEPKVYEMVSYRNISEPSDIGSRVGGAVVVALNGDRILLLHEFRMAVNSFVYNMVAGFKEPGETMEDCVRRELYEESGLKLVRIREVLRPAYAAVALSDVSNQLIIADVEGEISDHTENDELIRATFFSKEEVRKLIEEEPFTSRAQFVAYAFCHGFFDDKE
ncbi:MAG: NUDIX domain-containing protein [Lachnospiraceae bacterium]|nr:NUDIX domain-containing protein [Lachnospiraceae bacterium]